MHRPYKVMVDEIIRNLEFKRRQPADGRKLVYVYIYGKNIEAFTAEFTHQLQDLFEGRTFEHLKACCDQVRFHYGVLFDVYHHAVLGGPYQYVRYETTSPSVIFTDHRA